MVLWSLRKSQGYTKHDKKVWIEAIRFYDLKKCYHLEKQKSLPMSLARESYAKKTRTTPWTKNSRLRVEQLDLSI